MGKLTVKGNDLGTGTVILQGPNTNTPRTITLPDGTTTLVGHDTTQTLSNKTLSSPILTTPFLSNTALGSPAQAGEFEYDGRVPYFTPAGVERGFLRAQQLFSLGSNLAGANVNTVQSLFGVGVGLQASTTYQYETVYAMTKSAGATSHTFATRFGGTATLTSIFRHVIVSGNASAATSNTTLLFHGYLLAATSTVMTTAIAAAAANIWVRETGTVIVNAAGTFIPQYTLSAAPGGAYSTVAGSFFSIWPVGQSGSNVSIGNWA